MTLSTVLSCQEKLRDLQSRTQLTQTWHEFRAHVDAAVDADMLRYAPIAQQTVTDAAAIDVALSNLSNTINRCYQDLAQERLRLAPEYHQRSLEIYRAEFTRIQKVILDPLKRVEDFWNVRTAMTPEDMDLIRARLDAFNDWRVPGMIIRPGHDDWVDRLVALDPLYLVDLDQILLRPCMTRYPKLYQQRLRAYTIDETKDHMLKNLPAAQLGVVFCHDFFRTRPLHMIRKYLSEVRNLLREGGVFIFTYNDGDNSKSAMMVERGVNCYTPASEIRDLCNESGFDIVFEYQSDLGWNYTEIRRPGVMRTLRGGQSLARIRPIV